MSSPSSTTADQAGDFRAHAFIALGANMPSVLGTPAATVLAAMDEIANWSDQPLLRSSLWSSEPVDCPPDSPRFINAAVGMVPRNSESPRSLLTKLLELERRFGRESVPLVNAPRCLDLDLICYGDQLVNETDLVVPHPRAHRRAFVLLPLAEITPNLRLPGQSRSVSTLAQILAGNDPTVEKIDLQQPA